ncbi:hypothetical protein [Trinickia mobilis]|uniref:hypothetical protein n=1 Tax=Trinickia mobilis TaxID=2816356 RepID=UPI001A8E31EC|nr:hypothetical protein [Trinickia mobilis]
MQYVNYKDREYGVFAVQRDNSRWDAYYEFRSPHHAGADKPRYRVQSLFGFDSKLSAMQDAERNARADIDQGIGLPLPA